MTRDVSASCAWVWRYAHAVRHENKMMSQSSFYPRPVACVFSDTHKRPKRLKRRRRSTRSPHPAPTSIANPRPPRPSLIVIVSIPHPSLHASRTAGGARRRLEGLRGSDRGARHQPHRGHAHHPRARGRRHARRGGQPPRDLWPGARIPRRRAGGIFLGDVLLLATTTRRGRGGVGVSGGVSGRVRVSGGVEVRVGVVD